MLWRYVMAQLYFRYSTMNAGKSIDLIKVAYNYEERGQTVLALVPAVDDRYGRGVITSRIGVQREATIVRDDTNILELFMKENERKHIDCVLVDESQFLRKHHIEELVEIVDSCNTPVICYGLRHAVYESVYPRETDLAACTVEYVLRQGFRKLGFAGAENNMRRGMTIRNIILNSKYDVALQKNTVSESDSRHTRGTEAAEEAGKHHINMRLGSPEYLEEKLKDEPTQPTK